MKSEIVVHGVTCRPVTAETSSTRVVHQTVKLVGSGDGDGDGDGDGYGSGQDTVRRRERRRP